MNEHDERDEELLRRALRREAERVTPVGDGLAKIRARTATPAQGFGWLRIALVASAAAVVAVGAVSVLDKDETVRFEPRVGPSLGGEATTPTPTRTPTPPAQPTPAPSADGRVPAPAPGGPGDGESSPGVSEPTAVYVYCLGETEQGWRLYREQRTVDVIDGAKVAPALTAMFAGRPLDPDYESLWPRGTTVRGVSVAGGILTVDLSREALARSADAEDVEMSLQQFVHTVTANRTDIEQVRLWVDGEQISELWGHPIGEQPLRRAPRAAVQAPVWILAPTEDAEVGRTVELSGVASAVEATVNWEVRRSGRVVDSGYATATAAGPAFGDWTATVTLRLPGTYELRAFEVSMESGEPMFVDTKTVTVR